MTSLCGRLESFMFEFDGRFSAIAVVRSTPGTLSGKQGMRGEPNAVAFFCSRTARH